MKMSDVILFQINKIVFDIIKITMLCRYQNQATLQTIIILFNTYCCYIGIYVYTVYNIVLKTNMLFISPVYA